MPRRGSFPVALVASVAFLVLALVVAGGGAWLFAQEMDARKDRKKIADLEAGIRVGETIDQDHAQQETSSEFEETIREARRRREQNAREMNEIIAERNAIVRKRPEFGLQEMPPRTLPPFKLPK